MFLWNVVLKICSIFIGEHPCCSVILIKFYTTFIKVTLHDGCTSVNCCIFSVHLFIGTPLEDCFRNIDCVTSQKKGTLWNNMERSMERSETTIICNTEINLTFCALILCFFIAVLVFAPLRIWGIEKNGPLIEFVITYFPWNICAPHWTINFCANIILWISSTTGSMH